MNATSNTMMTPETAPRDAAALAQNGVFIHRRLAEALEALGFPVYKDANERTAFVTAKPEERAAVILQKLKELDASRGGAPAPAAAPAQLPAPAAQPAAAPAAAAPATSGRAPRTTKDSGSGSKEAPANGSGVLELLTAVKSLSDELKELRAAAQASSTVPAGIAGLGKEIESVKTMLGVSMKIQEVQLGLLCLFGQQVLQAPTDAFLSSAVDDANVALGLLEQMGKG